MSSQNLENGIALRRKTERDTEQSSARKCLRALFSHILVGPGEEKLDDCSRVHVVYLLFLLSFVLTTSSLHNPIVRREIEQELNGCVKDTREGLEHGQCHELVSAESITLRLGFSLAVTLLMFALLTLGSSRDGPRARIHQGFWMAKFFFILVLTSVSLYIPLGVFDLVWTAVSLIGAFSFQIFQSVLILDFATTASDVFVMKVTEERSKLWYVAWLLCVWLVHLTALGLVVVLYTALMDGCDMNGLLVTAVVIFCTLLTILTVQFSEHGTGLLHSGFVTLYVFLLTLVTLEQETACRKTKTMNVPEWGLVAAVSSFVQIILGFFNVAYAAIRDYNARHFCYGSSIIAACLDDENKFKIETVEVKGDDLRSRETSNTPRISPSFFYFLLTLFSLFFTSTLTTLKTSENNTPAINGTITFYLRSLMIVIILVMVIWTQVHPVLFPSENAFDFFALLRTFCSFFLKTSRRLSIDGCAFCNGPTASRYIFTLLFFLGLAFACFLYAPFVRHSLSANPYFCATAGSLGNCLSTDPAYMAVYRVCFAMATFYLLFAVVLVCVDDTRDPRVDLQYKAWPVKFCLFFSLLFCSFLLPKEFSRVWIYATLVGTFLFTILQLVLLIHWAKHTSNYLEQKVDESSSFWATFLMISTVLLFLICIAAVVIFYVFFTGLPMCVTNRIFVTLNLVLAIVASVTAVHPKIYDAGLFQCSIIVVFSVYLTWSGLSHNPEERCNPVAGYIAENGMRPNLNIQAAVDLLFTVITVGYFCTKSPALTEYLRELYRKIRHRQLSSQTYGLIESQLSTDSADCPEYNFSLFHFVYFLASLHATMILTNWFIPSQGSLFKLSVNWAAMWVKMTAASLSLVIYVWCIAAQLITN